MSRGDLSAQKKLRAFWRVIQFKPVLTVFLILFSVLTAVLEGIGLSFLIPIIEIIQTPGASTANAEGATAAFLAIYEFLGIPFTLGFIIFGVISVMSVRFASSFIIGWMRVRLEQQYVRELQESAFGHALNAQVRYFDKHGSDDILNTIVTQAAYAGRVIRDFVKLFEQLLLTLMYVSIAFYLAPLLTVAAAGVLGGLTFLIRNIIEPGYNIGNQVADANERIQQAAQAGTQGIRDVKLYNKTEDIYDDFCTGVEQFAKSSIKLGRNQEAINKTYNLSAAIIVFLLIYAALSFTGLSLGALGVFLFAMFQLAPTVSQVNHFLYMVEGNLPHLIRTQQFVHELEETSELSSGDKPVPKPPTPVSFEEVSFSYDDTNGYVLKDISFSVNKNEFIAFIGQSGAGKSTIISLIARLYDPDEGNIRANGVPIEEFGLEEWRSQVAVVRQQPYIFNDTLRYNVKIGNENATEAELRRACEIAHVTEYLEDLPNGYDTELGDEGVRLSGGQRQRISLARAILKDANILVLDEATSDLDTNIEKKVQSSIESMEQDYAIIAIAHRLSTVMNADQIYTLQDGEIIEQGEHEQLIRRGGKYAQLYLSQ